MAKLNNDLEIEIDGEKYALRASSNAASTISNRFNGFVGAFQALQMLDLSVVQFIIRTGITDKNISTKDLNEAVWRTGVGELTGTLAKYVSRLQNGGRDPNEEAAGGDDEGSEGNE